MACAQPIEDPGVTASADKKAKLRVVSRTYKLRHTAVRSSGHSNHCVPRRSEPKKKARKRQSSQDWAQGGPGPARRLRLIQATYKTNEQWAQDIAEALDTILEFAQLNPANWHSGPEQSTAAGSVQLDPSDNKDETHNEELDSMIDDTMSASEQHNINKAHTANTEDCIHPPDHASDMIKDIPLDNTKSDDNPHANCETGDKAGLQESHDIQVNKRDNNSPAAVQRRNNEDILNEAKEEDEKGYNGRGAVLDFATNDGRSKKEQLLERALRQLSDAVAEANAQSKAHREKLRSTLVEKEGQTHTRLNHKANTMKETDVVLTITDGSYT